MLSTIIIVKDWITAMGYRAVIIKQPMGHLCGYVGISTSHPLHGFNYDDDEIPSLNVHGGLTYSGGESNYPISNDENLWWYGFDCAHHNDYVPKLAKRDPTLYTHTIYRDESYVTKECEELARQLKDIADANANSDTSPPPTPSLPTTSPPQP